MYFMALSHYVNCGHAFNKKPFILLRQQNFIR